jgi:hypothetical protein
VTPLAELNPLVDGYLLGRFRSRRRLQEFESEPSRQPVYRVRLAEAISNDGTTLGQVDIVHISADLAAAHLAPGEWIGIVLDEEGLLVKFVRLDPPDGAGPEAIVDEALSGVEVPPDSPLAAVGTLPRSYSPMRPWMLGIALETILVYSPNDDACPFCQSPDVEFTDITLRCSTCTNGQAYAADSVAVRLGDLPADIDPYAFLSAIEDAMLLDLIPQEVTAA